MLVYCVWEGYEIRNPKTDSIIQEETANLLRNINHTSLYVTKCSVIVYKSVVLVI